MSETATRLLDQLLQLPESDRVTIADRLWESLSEAAQQKLAAEEPEDPAFEVELERRLESVENGTAELLEADTVFAAVREHLRRKRQQ
ncbi:addiction module protein [Gemmata sp. G18]|uniref:Addiction module protein n=1 Tax=Gemmata palustris TaxID=2822762 RepID=A0ABS5BMJ9_9BACT|nr:addiction module protein [Gemmata palustris]MBP3954515.1 addiction module protein [Gemmata palustris]